MDQLTKHARISAAIAALVNAGAPVAVACDLVLGPGTYAALAADLYDALRAKAQAEQNK